MLIGWSPRKKKNKQCFFFQGVNLPWRSKGGFCIRISQFHHFFLIESRFFALKKCHFLLVESTFLVNCLHFPPFLAAYFCWHLPSKYCWVPHWLYQIISFIIIFFFHGVSIPTGWWYYWLQKKHCHFAARNVRGGRRIRWGRRFVRCTPWVYIPQKQTGDMIGNDRYPLVN